MKSIKCSQCGLVNFADALVCKRCNYQLQNYSQTENQTYGTFNETPPSAYNYSSPYQNQYESNADTGAAVRKMFFGALWAGGGKYFVFWGAILFGVIDFLVGLNAFFSSKN